MASTDWVLKHFCLPGLAGSRALSYLHTSPRSVNSSRLSRIQSKSYYRLHTLILFHIEINATQWKKERCKLNRREKKTLNCLRLSSIVSFLVNWRLNFSRTYTHYSWGMNCCCNSVDVEVSIFNFRKKNGRQWTTTTQLNNSQTNWNWKSWIRDVLGKSNNIFFLLQIKHNVIERQ